MLHEGRRLAAVRKDAERHWFQISTRPATSKGWPVLYIATIFLQIWFCFLSGHHTSEWGHIGSVVTIVCIIAVAHLVPRKYSPWVKGERLASPHMAQR